MKLIYLAHTYTMTQDQNPLKSPSPESENLQSLRLQLQILPNGFSADYKNNIQLLYLRIDKNYTPVHDFVLPTYQQYIDKKIAEFEEYHPNDNSRDIHDMYYSGLTQAALDDFNMRVGEINDLVRYGEDVSVVKQRCKDLMRDFFEEKITRTIKDILGGIEQVL